MASAVITPSELGSIPRYRLECSICLNHFREPKMLDCLHCFCQKCLQELCKHQNTGGSKILCPQCRKKTILREVDNLPTYRALSALVEEVTMQEQLLGGQGSEIKCQACDDGNQALSRCVDCDYFLCHECQRAHERLSVMKNHKIYTMAQLQSGETTYKSKLREHVPKCEKHQDQKCNIFCNTCQQLVCPTCSVLDHKLSKHNLISLSEAFQKCKQDVAEQTAIAEKIKTSFVIAMNKTDESLQKFEINFADTKMRVSTKANEEVAKIRQEEQKQKHDLDKIYKDRVKTFETAQTTNSKEVTKAEQKLDEVKLLMTEASCYEILDLQQKLLKNLRELTKKQPKNMPMRLSVLDFEGERTDGQLVLEDEPKFRWASHVPEFSNTEQVVDEGEVGETSAFESNRLEDEQGLDSRPNKAMEPRIARRMDPNERWIFKAQTKTFGSKPTEFGFAYDVAVFSNSEIVVVDKNNKQLIKSSLTNKPKSPDVSRRLDIKGLTNPSHASINKDDQLIVLDDHDVKTFSKNCKFLHQFKPGRPRNSTPTCLAVDNDNLIAVGFKYDKQISLHKPDGSLIRTLHVPMIWEHLTMCKQRLVYTTYWNKMLSATAYDGSTSFSVDMTSYMQKYGGPNGVCCDREGSIYIAERVLNPFRSEIHHFGPDGTYIGCVIDMVLGVPWGISLTPDNDTLIVAAGFAIKTFHRVQGHEPTVT